MQKKVLLAIAVTVMMLTMSAVGAIGSNGSGSSLLSSSNSSKIESSSTVLAGNSSTLSLGLELTDYSFDTLNPLLPEYSGQGLTYLFYTPLAYVSVAPEAGLHAGLLKSWEASDGDMIWNLSLRPDLKWDNGKALNATDLAYSMDFYNSSIYGNALGDPMAHNATIINSTTVQLQFTKAYPGLMTDLADGAYNVVYAPEYDHVSMANMKNDSGEKNMVLDSPYVITNYTPGQNPIVLTRNPYYYDGTPYYKYLKIVLFDSSSAEVSALTSGEIAAVGAGGSTTTAKPFNVSGVSLHNDASTSEEMIQLNYLCYPTNITAVRQALAYAVNRTTLSEVGFGGSNYVEMNYGTVPNSELSYFGLTSSEISHYETNSSMVKTLMEKAGFKLVNGYWQNTTTGKTVSLTIIYPDYETEPTDIVPQLAEEWESAGFKVTISPLTSTTFTSEQCTPADYSAYVWDAYGYNDPYNSFVTNEYRFFVDYCGPDFHNSVVKPGILYDPSAGTNGTIAAIFRDYINASNYPIGSPQAIYWEGQDVLYMSKYVPQIPLYYMGNFVAYSNSIDWGNQTNYTGLFTTQGITSPIFWDQTLLTVHPMAVKKSPINDDEYIYIGVAVAAVIIVVGGVFYATSRRKKNRDKED